MQHMCSLDHGLITMWCCLGIGVGLLLGNLTKR